MILDHVEENAYNTVELPDGRMLGYGIFGDPEGYPALNFHKMAWKTKRDTTLQALSKISV